MDKVELYAKRFEISDIGINYRTAVRLVHAGYTLEDLKDLSYDDIVSIRGIGEKGARSVVCAVREYRKKEAGPVELLPESEGPKQIGPFSAGENADSRYKEYEEILIRYLAGKNEAVKLEECPILTSGMDEKEIPVYLEYLKKNERLSVTEDGIVLRLSSLTDFIKYIQPERERRILAERISGKTLKETSELFGITEKRVKELETKGLSIAKALNLKMNGTRLFEEDRYVYLYENYLFHKNDFIKYFEVSESQYNAIKLLSKKKRTKTVDADALNDDHLNEGFKAIIQRFLDKDFIMIDGQKILIKKHSIRDYILKTECKDETTIKSFMEANNSFVKAHKLEDRSELLIGKEQTGALENMIATRNDILRKTGCRFRYHDIASRDYSELLEELHLDSYENTLISTKKLMEENKQVMMKYDIRDEYELHDLLRKIYNTQDLFRQYQRFFPENVESRITFIRIPGLVFGSFDRDARVIELMKELSPISSKDFVSALSEEFGYSQGTITADWLDCVKPYKRRVGRHKEYIVEAEQRTKENME